MILKDATGRGYGQRIDAQNRAHTLSVTESRLVEATIRGATWNAGTGQINLTTDGFSAIAYIKNMGQRDLVVDLHVLLLGASANGTGLAQVEIIRNPNESGTIVTGGTEFSDVVQMNFGDALKPNADLFQGGEGLTVLGGEGTIRSQAEASSRLLLPIVTVLMANSKMGVRIQPPSGNTSMNVELVWEIYESQDDS